MKEILKEAEKIIDEIMDNDGFTCFNYDETNEFFDSSGEYSIEIYGGVYEAGGIEDWEEYSYTFKHKGVCISSFSDDPNHFNGIYNDTERIKKLLLEDIKLKKTY